MCIQRVKMNLILILKQYQVQRSPSGRVNSSSSYPSILSSTGQFSLGSSGNVVRHDQTFQLNSQSTFSSQTPTATAEFRYQSTNRDSSMLSENAQPG